MVHTFAVGRIQGGYNGVYRSLDEYRDVKGVLFVLGSRWTGEYCCGWWSKKKSSANSKKVSVCTVGTLGDKDLSTICKVISS